MPPEPPKLSPLQISISAAAAVTTTVAGSLFSDRGTLIGAGVGSVISGVATWGYAHAVHHARRGLPSVRVPPGRVWVAGGVMAVTLPVTLVAVTAFEAGAGTTLHSAVTRANESGTTVGVVVGGDTPRPSTPALKPSEATPSPPVSVTVPSGAVTASVNPSSGRPDPSGSPSAYLEPHPTESSTVPPSAPPGNPDGDEPAPTQPAPTGGSD